MEGKSVWNCDMLNERLKAKASHVQSLQDISKSMRLALMDKRLVVDAMDKSQLQKCLEQLQDNVKLHSLQGTLDRLECLAKQLGAKFSTVNNHSCFLECDMFYVEIDFDPNTGSVKYVKVRHESESTSSTSVELTESLSDGNFFKLTVHLQGLLAVYKLNADGELKSRAYPALRAMEADISRLAAVQTGSDSHALVHTGSVGLVQQRRTGRPMRLTFLVPPRQLLDLPGHRLLPLTADAVTDRQLGYWAEIVLVGGAAHQLQQQGLVTLDEGSRSPVFAAMTVANSCTLPATYQLRLSQPLPVDSVTMGRIQELTGEITNTVVSSDLLKRTVTYSNGSWSQKPFYVKLPDQVHCYYLAEDSQLEGVMLDVIPFTHPSHVPGLLTILRRQATLQALISSFVRTCPSNKASESAATCFEVTALTNGNLAVSFEYPHEDWLATLEIEISQYSPCLVQCILHTSRDTGPDEFSTKVLRACLSIPVTMRALLRRLADAPKNKYLRNDVSVSGMPSRGGDVQMKIDHSDVGPIGGSGEGDAFPLQNQQFRRPNQLNSYSSNPSEGFTSLFPVTTTEGQGVVEAGQSSSDQGLTTEMDNIEATVRQIKLDKAHAVVSVESETQASPVSALDLFLFQGGAAPNLPSSLTITPIPNKSEDRRKERRERDRSDRRRRHEDSPSSRSGKSGEHRSSPSSSRERDHNRECGSKYHQKRSSDSPPQKKHSHSSGSPSNKSSTTSLSVASKSKYSSSKQSHSNNTKHHSSNSKHSSPSNSHRSSGSSKSSSLPGPHTDKTKDKLKAHRVKTERGDAVIAASGGNFNSVPTSSGQLGQDRVFPSSDSRSPGRSRKGSLSDVINKLNTLVSTEDASKEDAPKGERSGEFTVKPSSEGIKLTINKTKSRSSSSSPSGMRLPHREADRNFSFGLKGSSTSGSGSRNALYSSGENCDPKSSSSEGHKSTSETALVEEKQTNLKSKGPDTHRLRKSDLVIESDLPPLPKSLEIKKIDRVTSSMAPAYDFQRSTSFTSRAPLTAVTATMRCCSPAPVGELVIDLGGSSHSPRPPQSSQRPPSTSAAGAAPFPSSPSVQIHIVRSPAPVVSPHQLCLISPRSSAGQPSPCVIDDELMDEALIGLSK